MELPGGCAPQGAARWGEAFTVSPPRWRGKPCCAFVHVRPRPCVWPARVRREIDVEEGQGLGPGIDDARLQLFGDHEVELPEVAGAGLFEKGQAGRFVDGDERFDESRFRLLERRHERFGGAGAAGVDEAAQRGHVHERQIAREHEDRLPEFPECGPYPAERPEAGFRVGDGTDARQG